MGLPEMRNESFVTAVLVLRDSNLVPGETGTPPEGASNYVILLHPAYQPGIEPEWFPQDKLDDLQIGEADEYNDPIADLAESAEEYGGTWVASFAHVPDSEFIVMVQQRASAESAGLRILVMFILAGLLVAATLRYVKPWHRKV